MKREPCGSVRLRHGINLASMAGRAVNEMPVGIRRQVLHLRELLVDREVHQRHIASAALGTLVVLREVVLHMTMFAVHSQRSAVSLVHDQEQSRGWNLLEEIDLDILEYLSRRFLLVTGDLLGNLQHESVVDFLIGRLLGGWLGGG